MAMVLYLMRRWNDEWETTTKTHTAYERVRKNADVNLSVCHCYIGRWLNRERKSHNEFAFLFIFSLCTYYNVFFFWFWYLVCLFRFSHWTLEWRKKSQVLLWFVFSIELPCTTDEQYVISLTMMTGKKKKHRQTFKILISNRKQAVINIIVAHYRNALASGCWLSWFHWPNSFNANPRENMQFLRINGQWLIGQCETSSLTKWKLSFAKISAFCTNSGHREPILTSRE